MNEDEKEEKGFAEGATDAVRKILKIKKIAPIIATSLPTIGIFLLIILFVVLVFLPIISTFSFSGGVFNSSTSNNESIVMPINLDGFDKEDVKIFQDFFDGKEKFDNLAFKQEDDEHLDLALLISTIQNEGLINFDDNPSFDLEKEIDKSLTDIDNLLTVDDFNNYIDKNTNNNSSSSNSDSNGDSYNGESIVLNKQNKDYYNQLKDKGGNVYYIYPGTRKLLGYMVTNYISYSTVVYDEWTCGDEICNNSSEIISDWGLLADISSNYGKNANNLNSSICYTAINNIEAAIGYSFWYLIHDYGDIVFEYINANYYTKQLFLEVFSSLEPIAWGYINANYDVKQLLLEIFNLPKPNTWDYINVEYDLKQLFLEVFNSEEPIDDVEKRIIELSGNSNAIIYGGGKFVKGQPYVAVEVKKGIDYDLYEKYTEDIFIKYVYLDCDNCSMKNETDEVKKKKARTIYDNIFNIKELFDYFNDANIYIDSPNSPGSTGGGTHSVDYVCSDSNRPRIVSYTGHKGLDLNGVPPGTNIYPLFEGTVVSINSCNKNYAPERHYDSNGAEYYTCANANAHNCGYGNMVKIQGKAADGTEYYAIYGHLSSIKVSVGDPVSMNSVIGTLGNTGCSTGHHLHLELRKVSDNSVKYADEIYVPASIQSVLCSR